MNTVRLRRLQADYELVRHLVRTHQRITIEGISGNPPDRYRLFLNVRSIRKSGSELHYVNKHHLEIWLPQDYPREPPVCRMLSPVFHPNIAPHAVCVGDHWTAAESLDRIIMRVCEMLAFQSYNTKSPLNGEAAQWVETHLAQLPLDKEELFIDLDAPANRVMADASACSNCEAPTGGLERCAAGHILCDECRLYCDNCKALLCLACGVTACEHCAVG
ncbi:MAG TPA: ubiquitin-conjugating enzyme E2 [Blastocatellia bacterium]|nr:ubiquitin-conjugating enzyme E2 [Blastocatellia bacterium]